MGTGATEARTDRCQRCFQPVPAAAGKCPHCGEIMSRSSRKVGLLLGICGLFLAIAIVVFSLFLQQSTPDDDSPRDSAPVERPAQPEKPPVLDR